MVFVQHAWKTQAGKPRTASFSIESFNRLPAVKYKGELYSNSGWIAQDSPAPISLNHDQKQDEEE